MFSLWPLWLLDRGLHWDIFPLPPIRELRHFDRETCLCILFSWRARSLESIEIQSRVSAFYSFPSKMEKEQEVLGICWYHPPLAAKFSDLFPHFHTCSLYVELQSFLRMRGSCPECVGLEWQGVAIQPNSTKLLISLYVVQLILSAPSIYWVFLKWEFLALNILVKETENFSSYYL